MQEIKINEYVYNIPISWDELNYWQACQVIKHVDDKAMQLNVLSKIPLEFLNAMPNNKVQMLFDLISFTENLEVFNSGEPLPKYKDFDYGNIEFGKSEHCKKIMAKEISGHEATAEMIQYLFDEDINSMPFLEIIGSANFFLTTLLNSIFLSPSLEKVKLAMSRCKQGSIDYKVLEGLLHTLNSQEVRQSVIP